MAYNPNAQYQAPQRPYYNNNNNNNNGQISQPSRQQRGDGYAQRGPPPPLQHQQQQQQQQQQQRQQHQQHSQHHQQHHQQHQHHPQHQHQRQQQNAQESHGGTYEGYDNDGFWSDYGGGPVDAYVYDQAHQAPAKRQYPGPTSPQGQSYQAQQEHGSRVRNNTVGISNGAGRYPPENQAYREDPRMMNRQLPSPQRQKQGRQPLISPNSPKATSFDNPFPTFPTKPDLPRSNGTGLEQGMGNMNIGPGRPSYEGQRPTTSGSKNSARSYQSQPDHGGLDMNLPNASQPSAGERYGGGRPSFENRGPLQRAMTLPEDGGSYTANDGRQHNNMHSPNNEFSRYRDPIPQRSQTSMADRHDNNFAPPPRSQTASGMRGNGYGHGQGPVPQNSNGSYATKQSSALDEYMPNFDSEPDRPAPTHDAIGIPLDSAPGIARPPTRSGSAQPQLQKSRSQPDLRARGDNAVYAAAPDAPAMPKSPYGVPGAQRSVSPEAMGMGAGMGMGMGLGMPARGPPPPGQGYHPHRQGGMQPHPNAQRRPGVPHRLDTDQSAWSDPGAGGRGQTGPMSAPITGPTRGPLGRMEPEAAPQSANPDALPAHPMPVRPGLMQDGAPQQGRAPAGRHYADSRNSPPRQGSGSRGASGGSGKTSSQKLPPITHEELFRLREQVKNNPNDSKTQLLLAKRLVEAASSPSLTDDGGQADPKTRAKNRERFVMEAYKNVKKLVSHSNTEAMFYLADSYSSGQLGLPIDAKEAFTLYQAAAKLGHGPAAYRTAVCCEMGGDAGGGTRRDPLKAVQWYRRAAALGDTPAMYKLGMVLLRGLLGQPASLGEAMIWLKRAADQCDEDNPHALHELAQIYETAPAGGKVIRDEAYALQLYEKGAKLGYRVSQTRLGKAYEYGELGCPIDHRSSIHWYSKAAAKEDPDAELALSGWYLTGSPGILDQNDQEAYLWARKAGRRELPKAEFAMGYFSEVGIGCPRSLDDAKRWYGRAASHNYPKAQERLEELKKGGPRVQKNRERISRSGKSDDCVVM